MNDSTTPTARQRKTTQPTTGWELSRLIQPLSRPRPRTTASPVHHLQPYYPEVLHVAYQLRFATGSQIARMLPEHLSSERTTQRRLSHLVSLNLLGEVSTRSTGPCFPRVYFVTAKGLRWLKAISRKRGREFNPSPAENQRQRGRALDTTLHELLLSEFQVAMEQTIQGRDDLVLHFSERRYFRRENQLRFEYQGRLHRLIPDAGFLITGRGDSTPLAGMSPNRDFATFLAVELDNGTMSIPRLREKLWCYYRWLTSAEATQYLQNWAAQTPCWQSIPSFRLLLIAHDKLNVSPEHDQYRLRDLLALSLEFPRQLRDRIWLTTVAQLSRFQQHPLPLSTPLWLRAKDAQPGLTQPWKSCGTRSETIDANEFQVQKIRTESQIRMLPAHPLLPR